MLVVFECEILVDKKLSHKMQNLEQFGQNTGSCVIQPKDPVCLAYEGIIKSQLNFANAICRVYMYMF